MLKWLIIETWRGIFGASHRHHFRPRRGHPSWFLSASRDLPIFYECRCGEWLHHTAAGWKSRTDYREEEAQLHKRLDRLETQK